MYSVTLLESYDFFLRSGISFIDQEQYYNQTQCNAVRMTGPGATHPSHTHTLETCLASSCATKLHSLLAKQKEKLTRELQSS